MGYKPLTEAEEAIKGIPTFSALNPFTWGYSSRTDLLAAAQKKIDARDEESRRTNAAEAEIKRKAKLQEEAIKNALSPEEVALNALEDSIEADINKVSGATKELKSVNAKLNLIQKEAEELHKTVTKQQSAREHMLKDYHAADDYRKRELEMDIIDLEESIEDEQANLANTKDHLNVLDGSAQALKMDIRGTNRRIRQHRSKLKQGRSLLSTRSHVGNVDGYLKGISDESSMNGINLLIEEVKGDINERLQENQTDVTMKGNVSLRLAEEAAQLSLAAPTQEQSNADD